MSVYPGMTAGEIITGVHDGAFTVQDVADAHMSRIDEVDVEIRAFATVDADLVRTEAAWLDAQRQAGARLPLHGVPVGVKDIIDVAGLPTIAGSSDLKCSRIAWSTNSPMESGLWPALTVTVTKSVPR